MWPMIKTFTKNDLLLYAYGETNKKDQLDIQNALICDENLQEEYRTILSAMNYLDKAAQKPSEKVVSKILEFSKSFKLQSVVK
jgi:hypothetical protein